MKNPAAANSCKLLLLPNKKIRISLGGGWFSASRSVMSECVLLDVQRGLELHLVSLSTSSTYDIFFFFFRQLKGMVTKHAMTEPLVIRTSRFRSFREDLPGICLADHKSVSAEVKKPCIPDAACARVDHLGQNFFFEGLPNEFIFHIICDCRHKNMFFVISSQHMLPLISEPSHPQPTKVGRRSMPYIISYALCQIDLP